MESSNFEVSQLINSIQGARTKVRHNHQFFCPFLNSFHQHSFYIHVTSAHSERLKKDLLYTRIGLGHIHSQELGV